MSVNNLKTNPLVDLFILKYLLFSLIGPTKNVSYIYIYIPLTHTYRHIFTCILTYTYISMYTWGTSSGVIVSKLDEQIFGSEFDSP